VPEGEISDLQITSEGETKLGTIEAYCNWSESKNTPINNLG
jgi:hypothetical protein